MNVSIGNTIRIIRQAKGLKLRELAQAAEVSTPFVTLVEKGGREPSLAVLRRIAKALDVPPEALILLSQPTEGRMETRDVQSQGLVASIQRLVRAEEDLREFLGGKANAGHEAMRPTS